MAIPNFYMPFNQGTTWKQDTRNRPSKYAQSDLRNWRFEQSEGIRPAEYFAAYKFLPVCFKDITTEDYVVLLKGRIVSAIGHENATPLSGIVYPSSSGQITIANQGDYMGTGTGAKINVNIDDSYFGYSEYISSLLVPCNGGTTSSGFYTADDVLAGTRTAGGARAAASGAFTLPANAPIGVVYHDWYQDIRGEWLNYRMHEDGGHVLCDWFVEVPYIKAINAGLASGCSPRFTNATYSDLTAYWQVNNSFTYLSIEQGETLQPGMFVQSDLIGNYMPQPAPGLTLSGSAVAFFNTTNMPKTNQTVGKVISMDCRMPKGGLEDVLTYPRSGMPGSQTAGMIKVLFDFAYECLKAGQGSAPTVEAVYNAIRSGAFGLARIQLLIA
jgi:hypothetical protein